MLDDSALFIQPPCLRIKGAEKAIIKQIIFSLHSLPSAKILGLKDRKDFFSTKDAKALESHIYGLILALPHEECIQ